MEGEVSDRRYIALTLIDTKSREFDPKDNPAITQPALAALFTMRLIKEGIRDHYFTADTVKQLLKKRQGDALANALDALLAKLGEPAWARGKIASSKDTVSADHPLYADWISDADLAAYVPFQNMLNAEFIETYQLLGWPAWNLGETCHARFSFRVGSDLGRAALSRETSLLHRYHHPHLVAAFLAGATFRVPMP